MPRSNVSAAIVAGGEARRFSGQDKSRLVVDGRPIIVRQVDVLQSIASRTYVVGGLPDRYDDLGLRVYPDLIPGTGALGGIYTALASATTAHVLVVACDMPFLDAALLLRLVDLADGRDAAWVTTERGPEPLLACYRTSVAGQLRARLEAGHLKARDIVETLDIATLGSEELASFGVPDRLLANVNTSDDYARVQYRRS